MKSKIIFPVVSFFFLFSVICYFFYKDDFKRKAYKEDHRVAYDALQFISTASSFPGIDIPPAAYGEAWDFYKLHYSNTSSKIQNNATWQSMGPQNVGGRTISIAIDPADTNIIWLGSASGGLWKSTTGGYGINAWQYIQTGFPVLGVGAIAINPFNTNEMYIGTGETYDYGTSVNGLVIRTTRGSNGIGILKSVDGGTTWTQSLNWNYNQNRGVWEIIINPLNPNTLYAATTAGVYKSTDAGANWSLSLNYTMVMDLKIDQQDTAILYAGVGNLTSPVHGLFKTGNAGATWSQLTNGLPTGNSGRITIDIYKGNSAIVMAHFANDLSTDGLYRSVNKGQTWTQVNSDDVASYQGWYAKCLKIKDDDSSHVMVGGVDLYESFDNGVNLNQITYYLPGAIDSLPWSDLHGLISNPFDKNKLYLLTDAGLYRSNDYGLNWKWCANGYNVSQFYHGSVAATDSNIALGGLQDRNTYRYNGTLTWQAVAGGDGTFNAIDPTDPSIQYAASQYLYIGKSTDSGYTFFNIFQGNTPAFVAPYMLAHSNPSVIYAGDENLNYSNDKGNTWIINGPVDNYNPILSMDVSYTDENKIYFATAPTDNPVMHVFLSTDAGSSYTDISSGLPNRYPRDIAVDPSNDNIAYIVFSGFGSGHIYKTTNNGNNWTDISLNLPDIPFHTVLVNPNNADMIFAGCDYGVFVSADGGATWQTLNSGLPQAVMVFDLEYSASDNHLVAFTHGNGAYKIDLDYLVSGIKTNVSLVNNFMVYPTLASQQLILEFSTGKVINVKFIISDISGKKVYEKNFVTVNGKNKINILLPSLKDGMYFCRLENENLNGEYLKKIVVFNSLLNK